VDQQERAEARLGLGAPLVCGVGLGLLPKPCGGLILENLILLIFDPRDLKRFSADLQNFKNNVIIKNMKAKTDKKRLELLFKGLKEFSCEGIFDMGLIISKSVPKKSELDQFFPKGIQHEVISVGKESFPDDVIAEILDASL